MSLRVVAAVLTAALWLSVLPAAPSAAASESAAAEPVAAATPDAPVASVEGDPAVPDAAAW